MIKRNDRSRGKTRNRESCPLERRRCLSMKILAVAVLVDPVVRDFPGTWMPVTVGIVAVTTAEPLRKSIAVPVVEKLHAAQ